MTNQPSPILNRTDPSEQWISSATTIQFSFLLLRALWLCGSVVFLLFAWLLSSTTVDRPRVGTVGRLTVSGCATEVGANASFPSAVERPGFLSPQSAQSSQSEAKERAGPFDPPTPEKSCLASATAKTVRLSAAPTSDKNPAKAGAPVFSL